MKLLVFVFVIASALACCGQENKSDSAIAKFFTGNWSCAGKFASGKTIEADVNFTPELDGKWLLYRHTDRPPGPFKALSLWGVDQISGNLVSYGRQFRQCAPVYKRWMERWIGNIQPHSNARPENNGRAISI